MPGVNPNRRPPAEVFGEWRPSAVVFDCDGLLVDTEPCWTKAESEIFARRGLEYTREIKAVLIGRYMADVADALAEIFGETGNGPAIQMEIMEAATRVILEEAAVMPGAEALVACIAKALPVAVASNSPRALLDVTLERGGFHGVFPVSVAGNEVTHPKPHPEIYATICTTLGADPADTLAFEDSATGVRAASEAGLRVIGVPTLGEYELPADVVVDSLLAPELKEWISWLEAGGQSVPA